MGSHGMRMPTKPRRLLSKHPTLFLWVLVLFEISEQLVVKWFSGDTHLFYWFPIYRTAAVPMRGQPPNVFAHVQWVFPLENVGLHEKMPEVIAIGN